MLWGEVGTGVNSDNKGEVSKGVGNSSNKEQANKGVNVVRGGGRHWGQRQ
jgi:hypothetical protein